MQLRHGGSGTIRVPAARRAAGSLRLRPGSGGGVNVGSDFGGNDFTYRKLFHLLIRNCFITCHLLIEATVGRAPKFVSIGYFCDHLVTNGLLIELYPMVPFPSIVLEGVSDYTRTPPQPHPCRRLDRTASTDGRIPSSICRASCPC